ncbi:uncharacterized protein LOC142236055 [Haematobia irritans]|uniref:uncharacterized protein LOC142236055 n=1 Tax=Haematobia irritans TaxID=7368 RepID=UPI003F502FAC
MACVYNNSNSFNSTGISKSLDKSSLTPASSMKKLLKTVRKIIFNSKKEITIPGSGLKVTSTPIKYIPVVILGCMTEEEHHNWLNEQLEDSFISNQQQEEL